jgi:hypothetical protein
LRPKLHIALSFGVFLIWPESPTSIDHYGEFDIYDFHSTNIGEPGYTLYELYCHGKRLAEFPRALSINPGKDRVLYVDAADAGLTGPIPARNGLYYFDALTKHEYKVLSSRYPSFLNADFVFPLPGQPKIENAYPWSPDGRFAVVSYGEDTNWMTLKYDVEAALIVDLENGKLQNAAGLLGVSQSEHIIFRGWSEDTTTMIFDVGRWRHTLPISAALQK